jgi:hypothetical protein
MGTPSENAAKTEGAEQRVPGAEAQSRPEADLALRPGLPLPLWALNPVAVPASSLPAQRACESRRPAAPARRSLLGSLPQIWSAPACHCHRIPSLSTPSLRSIVSSSLRSSQ